MGADLALGVDIGTGGARAVLVDDAGAVAGSGAASYQLLTPEPGLAEQRPEDWWEATCAAIATALNTVSKDRIVGVGLTGQMHGAVIVGSDLRPLRTAPLWCDSRAAKAATAVTKRLGTDWLIAEAGNPPLPGFTAPLLRSLADGGDEALDRASWVLCAKDFVRAMLTGVALTEPSDASGTGLYSVSRQDWSSDLAAAYGVDARLLPPIVPSGSAAGTVTRAAARATGLAEGIPVAAGAADNAAAALASGVIRSGELMISVGTSGTLLAPTDGTPDPSGRCHLFRHATEDGWYSMAVVLSAGGALSWWERVTGAGLDQLAEEAAEIPPGSDGLLMLPYLSGERMPRDRPEARGSFVGLSLAHGRAHMTRAILEGAGFALADGLACLREVGVQARRAILTGAASSHRLWQEVISLALPGIELAHAKPAEGAALGAALLGFQATGRSLDELLQETVTVESVPPFDQTPAARESAAAAYRRFQAISNDPLLTAAQESDNEERQ